MKQRADGRWLKVKTIDGKKVFFYSCEETEKKALKDIEKQMLDYSVKLAERKVSSKKFKEIANEWENQKREEVSEATWSKSYFPLLNELVGVFGEYDIAEITPEFITQYFLSLKAKKYSLKSVSSRKSVLNMIFRIAFVKGFISNNFILNIPIKKPAAKRVYFVYFAFYNYAAFLFPSNSTRTLTPNAFSLSLVAISNSTNSPL